MKYQQSKKIWNLLKSQWQRIRPKKKLTRYGTVGRHVFGDDRSFLEKLRDIVDIWIDRIKPRFRETHIWRSFQDISTGEWVHSYGDIKRIEKKYGLHYMDWKDIDKEAKRNHKYNMERQQRMVRKGMQNIVRNIKNGRSYVKEMNERIRRGDYQIGQQKAFNEAR